MAEETKGMGFGPGMVPPQLKSEEEWIRDAEERNRKSSPPYPMPLVEIREKLESLARTTCAELGTGCEGEASQEAVATALVTLTRCVLALTEHLDGEGR